MKKNFITGCLLLIYCQALMAQINRTTETDIQLKGNHPAVSQSVAVIRCGGSSLHAQVPLFVLDGMLVESEYLKNIDPSEILNIEVLKDNAAAALFGYRASNGVVLITTRRMNQRKFFISDFSDGAPLPSASVSLISVDTKDTLMFMSDEEGIVVTDKLDNKKKYTIYVSAVGYKDYGLIYDPGMKLNSEILLVRNEKVCEEAVVVAYCRSGCRLICCGGMVVSTINNNVSPGKESASSFTVYPNPARRGSNINLQYVSVQKEKVQARVISVNGQLLYSREVEMQEGKNQFQFPVNAAYNSGIYFVQLVNKKNKSIYQQKVFIE